MSTLFSYPSTREAYSAPKRHTVTIDPDYDSDVQFTLERGSRSFRPGATVRLSDFELSLIDPDLFDQGILTRTGGVNNAVGADDSGVSVQEFAISLPDVDDGVIASFEAPFDGAISSWDFIVTTAVTTGDKTTTLTPEIEGDPVQGTGDATMAITSAAATPKGKIIAGEAPASANTFEEGDTIDIVASATTAFTEGAGVLRLTLVAT